MSNIRAGSGPDTNRSFTCTGEWWVPGSSLRIFGTLTFSPSSRGATLDLLGALQPGIDEYAPPAVIFGLTPEKGRVTICDPARGGSVMTMGGQRMDREQWVAATVFTGANLEEGWQTPFASALMRTARLDDWTNLPKAHHERDQLRHSLSLDVPAPVLIPVDHGEISLEWWETIQHGQSASVSVSAFLRFSPSSSLSFSAIWRDTLSPLFLMLCLFTGTRDRIETIKVFRPRQDTDDPFEQIEVHIQRWGDYEPGDGHRHNFLVRYEDLTSHFPEVVPAWLSMYERTHLSMMEFFSDRLAPAFYVEDRFVRIARSMEMWHRDIIGGELMEQRLWQDLVTKAKNGLSDASHRKILRERLAHGNEPSLRQRMEEITAISGQPMKDEIRDHPDFLRFVVSARNDLTHGSRSPDPERLVSATYLLELTFTCALLRHLGLPESEVEELIRRSELGRWLFWSGANPWGPFETTGPVSRLERA